MRTYLVLTALAMSLTACGGGGGEAAGGGDVTQPPAATTIGSRAMPGSALTVTSETAITAGQVASVIISAPGLPAGATVTATVGVDRVTAAAATISALSGSQWRAAMTLPNPLPIGTCMLVTVTMPDGSVLESGIEDFVLVR